MAAFSALVEASTLFRENIGGGEFFLVGYVIAFQIFLMLEGFSYCRYILFAPSNIEGIPHSPIFLIGTLST